MAHIGARLRNPRWTFGRERKGSRRGSSKRNVTYRTLPEMRETKFKVKDLPVVKRIAFEDELEFRLLFESATDSRNSFGIEIPISAIDRIVVSPWIHRALYQHVRTSLNSVVGCSGLKVTRSTVISNEEWKSLGDGAS